MSRLLVSFLTVLGFAGSTVAQEAKAPLPLPEAPMLRIDPGMHTSTVWRVGVDAKCTVMATGSEDKTVRVWSLPTGKGAPELLRTMRVPAGEGFVGKIFALSMSPDGKLVAAGGWTGATGAVKRIYVFEVATGRLVRVIDGLNNVVKQMAFSADSRSLAATLGGGMGVRVWDTKSWDAIGDHREYGNKDSYGVAFDGAGNLYTVADDGRVRRYKRAGKGAYTLAGSAKTEGGGAPSSVAASTDGDRIAVSFYDSADVEVLDADTLKNVRTADPARPGGDNNLGAVTWFSGGDRLVAGGKYDEDGSFPLRIWGKGGKDKGRDVHVGARSTIMDVKPCGKGLAVSGADGFGLVGENEEVRFWVELPVANMRDALKQNFQLSDDGRRVWFGLSKTNVDGVLFDLAAEGLSEKEKAPEGLSGPRTTGLPVNSWEDDREPKFENERLELMAHEKSRALAVAPDKKRFVLGTEWAIRGYTSDGKPAWKGMRQSPGVAWAVNISGNGKLIVAGYGDGTIRWHRLEDGEELLALFVHRIDRRWVAWTPKGYYMASPGAEGLIGWHINKGWEGAAEFYPADRFRAQFNRPDIVKLVLDTLDEGKAINEANRMAKRPRADEDVRALAPPVVRIDSPAENALFRDPEVTVEYTASSPMGKRITDIDIRVNGKALGSRAAVPANIKSGERIAVKLNLPPEDVAISIVAREGERVSEPAVLRLRWDGAKTAATAKPLPRLRALLIGIDAYSAKGLAKLAYAAKDAGDLERFFKAEAGQTYSSVETRVLANATRGDVLDGLDWLEKQSEAGDINLLFLSGHGITDDQQHYYYMAADSDPAKARSTGVSGEEILHTIRNRSGAMVVLLDTCRTAAGAEAADAACRVDMNRVANELGDRTLGVFLYTATQGRQLSRESDKFGEGGNGVFTAALIEGLGGKADRDNLGYVESDELAVYVRRRVMALTGQAQEPVRMKPDAQPELRLVTRK